LPALLRTLDMMYADKTLQLTTDTPENITCPVDREDMLELLGNLLDHAYKWAAHKIVLSVRIESGIHICIEDDGPGADPEKINTQSRRGVRLDEKIQGHGFGLTSDKLIRKIPKPVCSELSLRLLRATDIARGNELSTGIG
ncbi:MAG: ATP-binding protein, partial [Pseudomonadota bacterium]|nr:ATP-binding protein [Pseudomonadota bacterium]